jgi:hypothetical protein
MEWMAGIRVLLNAVVKWAVFLLCIAEDLDSDLILETGFPVIFVLFHIPSGIVLG